MATTTTAGTTSEMTQDQLKRLLEYLKNLPFTKFERLQIVNLVPINQVEFYTVILYHYHG